MFESLLDRLATGLAAAAIPYMVIGGQAVLIHGEPRLTQDIDVNAIARAKTVQIGSASVQFASVEDLIVHKIVAGRPRDLDDVRAVLRKNPNADRTLVRTVLADFTAALGQDLVGRFEAILDSNV